MCVRTTVLLEAISVENSENLVDRLIALSDARQADRITVAGRWNMNVLLALYRRGFLRVTCRTAAEGPHGADNAADSFWILAAENAGELRTLIARCGRDLRSNGTLIIGYDQGSALGRAARLRDVLSKCGFFPLQQIYSSRRGLLVCARKLAPAETMAA